jgi:hypothetical protein
MGQCQLGFQDAVLIFQVPFFLLTEAPGKCSFRDLSSTNSVHRKHFSSGKHPQETLQNNTMTIKEIDSSHVLWYMPVISAILEAEAGGSRV